MHLVFVHGAFVRDGAWWWNPVARLVEQRTGVTTLPVVLPSCGEAVTAAGADGPGLGDDAAALRAVLDAAGEAVVVAHSYGGTVAAEGADHPAVRHLVLISSFLPLLGESQADAVGASDDPVPVRPLPDGSLAVDADDRGAFTRRFLHDVSDRALVDGAFDRLTGQSPAALGTPTTRAAWQDVPSTYLVCADDRSTSPERQRIHAARAGAVHDLPTGHHPMLSRPDLVADHLIAVLEA